MEQDFGSYFSIAPLFLILSLMATLDLLRLLIFCLKHGIKTSCVQTPWEVMIISKLIHGWQLGILIFFSSKSYEYRFRGFSQICLKGKLWLIEVSKSLRGEGTVGELTLGVFSRDGSLGIGKYWRVGGYYDFSFQSRFSFIATLYFPSLLLNNDSILLTNHRFMLITY